MLLSLILVAIGCEKKLEDVDVEFTDPIRHYYPVIQGELLGITYEIENTSENPLFIQEVQTTCGCVVTNDELPLVVLPNKTGKLSLTYNSTKNVGHVEHFIWVYGNFKDSTWRELRFDTNVVPPRDYTRDYEEIVYDIVNKSPNMKDLIDGRSTDKGYYTDEGIDPRFENQEVIQQEVDRIIGF